MLFKLATLPAALLGVFTVPVVNGAEGVYDYDHTEVWGDVNADCDGKSNSPIAFDTMDCTANVDYKFSPGTCTIDNFDFKLTNNGVYMGLNSTSCQAPQVEIPNVDTPYTHLQTHIHLSSEHSVDGGFYGAEMHMVHSNGDENSPKMLAVVGTMVEPTAMDNNPMFEAWLQRWIEYMNKSTCESCFEEADVQPFDLNVYQGFIGKDFWHYEGGLTTPPCSEIVYWNFSTKPMKISVRQYQMLTEMILDVKKKDKEDECADFSIASFAGSTSRPPQPLNGRSVAKYCSFNR